MTSVYFHFSPPMSKCNSCTTVRPLPEDVPVTVPAQPWIKAPYLPPMSSSLPHSLAHLPSCVTPPHGARPMWGQKEVSTQHARCWIGCYFSRSTGPNPAQGGGGGSGDRTCRAGERGQNFPVLSICNLVTNREKWVSEG